MGLDQEMALQGELELAPGDQPLVLGHQSPEGVFVELYYRVALTLSGDFILVDATGVNRCHRLLPGIFTNGAYNVKSRDFPPFVLSRNELSGPGSFSKDEKARAPFVRVFARQGKLILSQQGLNVRKSVQAEAVDEISVAAGGAAGEVLAWEDEKTQP